jgi:hypothetical protein
MPTATKKMAANMSRRGNTSRSISRTRPLPEASIPARKAPRAREHPARAASTAATKHTPTVASSRVSSRPRSAAQRSTRGTTRPPPASMATRNNPTRPRVPARPAPPEAPAGAAASSPARSRMAMRSCTTSTESTPSRRGPLTPCSSKSLAMIMVLEMARAAPMNALWATLHPRARPARNPSQEVMPSCMVPMTRAEGPLRRSLRTSNSSPTQNRSSTTPSSARVLTFSTSATRGTGTWGPTMRPASMQPNTAGCFIQRNRSVVKPATPRTMARSRISWGICGVMPTGCCRGPQGS